MAATGTDLKYQWQIDRNDGKGFADIAGADRASYTTSAVDKNCNGYKYQCVISNSAGSVTTGAATLTVTEDVTPPVQPTVKKPGISKQPQNVSVKAGEQATFTVKATGTDLTYQWQINRNNGKGFVDITGADKASYTTGVANCFAMVINISVYQQFCGFCYNECSNSDSDRKYDTITGCRFPIKSLTVPTVHGQRIQMEVLPFGETVKWRSSRM